MASVSTPYAVLVISMYVSSCQSAAYLHFCSSKLRSLAVRQEHALHDLVRFDLVLQLLMHRLRMLQLLSELRAGQRRDRTAIISEPRTPQADRSRDFISMGTRGTSMSSAVDMQAKTSMCTRSAVYRRLM
jgi:hypothetical protein